MEQVQHIPSLNQEQLNELTKKYPNLTVLPQNLVSLPLSIIKNKDCNIKDFRYHSNRVIRLTIEQALAVQDQQTVTDQQTPLARYDAQILNQEGKFVSILIMRSANAFMPELMNVIPDIEFGCILVQRDENSKDKAPVFYYEKYPKNLKEKSILICDPMLATGGSVVKTELKTSLNNSQIQKLFVLELNLFQQIQNI
ncbi:hypothetical protein PPERSA_05565 [Pseudocohnilembus persalinus]|uniref:Phosphoribosyltransferase domain-containing protein n=1 Tax=Pseudocohnilembus persalinus TaxID=266149 RepID=A0A0V0Q7L2_PSEPJ|nr:hypothetical protein PPERSA_05565 [Pseudocohnilembus persalinus]|eukprot:KRW98221.1 hypothetical protein PPERSA_05565 [Pseudocohnilembus persalinus]